MNVPGPVVNGQPMFVRILVNWITIVGEQGHLLLTALCLSN